MSTAQLIHFTPVVMLTALRLEKLVLKAHQGDEAALKQLCRHFQPLIYKEAHRESVYRCLGEDAINIAWEYFLLLIKAYHGANYQQLPGYLQLKIHFHLIHLMQKQGKRWEQEEQAEKIEELPQATAEEELTLTRVAVHQLLQQLQPQQRQLLQLICQKKSQQQIARQLHCSPRTVQRKLQGLRKQAQELAG